MSWFGILYWALLCLVSLRRVSWRCWIFFFENDVFFVKIKCLNYWSLDNFDIYGTVVLKKNFLPLYCLRWWKKSVCKVTLNTARLRLVSASKARSFLLSTIQESSKRVVHHLHGCSSNSPLRPVSYSFWQDQIQQGILDTKCRKTSLRLPQMSF